MRAYIISYRVVVRKLLLFKKTHTETFEVMGTCLEDCIEKGSQVMMEIYPHYRSIGYVVQGRSGGHIHG